MRSTAQCGKARNAEGEGGTSTSGSSQHEGSSRIFWVGAVRAADVSRMANNAAAAIADRRYREGIACPSQSRRNGLKKRGRAEQGTAKV